eukprot:c14856_g2_i1 orf=56-223(+)
MLWLSDLASILADIEGRVESSLKQTAPSNNRQLVGSKQLQSYGLSWQCISVMRLW